MTSVVPYTLVLAGLVLTASLVVLGQSNHDECAIKLDCVPCVNTKINTAGNPNETIGNNGTTCIWELSSSGPRCTNRFEPSPQIEAVYYTAATCASIPGTGSTTPAPSNATTPATTPTPSSNGTTPTTPSTTASTPTNATTPSTTAIPTTTTTVPSSTTTTIPTTTNGTTPVTTPVPASSTTATPGPKPTPAPKGGFSWASFIGGIVFAAALSSLAYLIWRFYKVRLDRNYHTFSNPTF